MMIHRIKLAVLTISIAAVFTACQKEGPEEENFVGVEGISFENYPKIDGSTSARALIQMATYKLLGVRYDWDTDPWEGPGEWFVSPREEDIPERYREEFMNAATSNTHEAFMHLIDGEADIILTHRTLSPDEKAHAGEVGVTLLETPVASDAFVFIKNKNNPVKSLTVEQIQKIYTGEITNWSQAGWRDAPIEVFTRPRNSGSEEIFRTLVMDGRESAEFPEATVWMMWHVFREVLAYEEGFCYTFDNYKEVIARRPDSEVPRIAVNGVFPSERTVRDGTYPFVSQVHVAIRSDLDPGSMAYKLYEWLQSENAKSTIAECGFLPD
ncbi:MAG: substrate-binding domain-containing protein [Rikenellaceae bacterium]|jgi:phosphate transport system substrate-binding protein|nr:substrate-binding domain-containing protein [Rikenellaceae bacterium]